MSSYLITGCSRGLGLEFVRELVEQGQGVARLIFATSRSQQAPEALQDIINGAPDRVKYVPLDVTGQESIEHAVKLVTDILGSSGLDILINNAGIPSAQASRTLDMTSENLLTTLTTNVVATHNVTRAFMPLLKAGRDKKLMNISSTMGSISMTVGYPDFFKQIPSSAYNISKAALNSLTIQHAIDLKDQGFTVMAISPGHLQTSLGGMNAPLTASDGARATLKIIQEANSKDTARFRNIYIENDSMHDGKDPAW